MLLSTILFVLPKKVEFPMADKQTADKVLVALKTADDPAHVARSASTAGTVDLLNRKKYSDLSQKEKDELLGRIAVRMGFVQEG